VMVYIQIDIKFARFLIPTRSTFYLNLQVSIPPIGAIVSSTGTYNY